MAKAAQDTYLLTPWHGPPQDMSPEECVYTYDPSGLNILKKGCAHYCNQTFLVSFCGHPVPGDLGHSLLPGAPRLGRAGCLPQRDVPSYGGKGAQGASAPPL